MTLAERDRSPVLRLLAPVLAVAPLVALPGHLDFSRLPQQAFVQLGVRAAPARAAT